MSAGHRSFAAAVLLVLVAAGPASALTDVGLLVYPAKHVTFRYDPGDYEVKQPADPMFDPAFAVAGFMLWNRPENRVAFEVYRAQSIAGFEMSANGRSEYYTLGNMASICIDGFSEYPRQLSNICVEFQPYPPTSAPVIYIDGVRIEGLRHYIPSLSIATPAGNGFYSDRATFHLRWLGAQYVRIIAYADKNGNRVFDGEPTVSTFMEDLTIPTEERTWGSVKALYGDR
ncbi:MAG: hypothetical protein H6Q78_150 [Candidatus Krumholzibacteriota bacterium]|jgi:hypothetical protein|nr:hypothetical protein [Candidatus Krumholzibacteriota bacterium]